MLLRHASLVGNDDDAADCKVANPKRARRALEIQSERKPASRPTRPEPTATARTFVPFCHPLRALATPLGHETDAKVLGQYRPYRCVTTPPGSLCVSGESAALESERFVAFLVCFSPIELIGVCVGLLLVVCERHQWPDHPNEPQRPRQ